MSSNYILDLYMAKVASEEKEEKPPSLIDTLVALDIPRVTVENWLSRHPEIVIAAEVARLRNLQPFNKENIPYWIMCIQIRLDALEERNRTKAGKK